MSLFFIFLAVFAVAAVIVAIVLTLPKDEKAESEKKTRTPVYGNNLGAPLFNNCDQRTLVLLLNVGDKVWGLTPFGPQLLTVQKICDGAYGKEAHLRNGSVEVLAVLDTAYLSEEIADKLNQPCAAWRIEICRALMSMEFKANNPHHETDNRHWLEDEAGFDLFDPLLLYYFIFDGFGEDLEYYETYAENYDMPVYEDPPEEPVSDSEEAEEDFDPHSQHNPQDLEPPAEVTEETFEEGVGEEPVEVEIVEAEIVVDEPVPQPVPQPEPEPEPDRSWGGDSDDFGASS